MRKHLLMKLVVLCLMLLFSAFAYAEETAVSTAVSGVIADIGTYVPLIIGIGVASLGITMAVKVFGWIRSAIK